MKQFQKEMKQFQKDILFIRDRLQSLGFKILPPVDNVRLHPEMDDLLSEFAYNILRVHFETHDKKMDSVDIDVVTRKLREMLEMQL